MNPNTIINGDSAEVLKTFDADCIDLTVTSPPYDNLRTYNGFVFDFETIARELYRVTKPGGVVVWVVGDATINGSETGTSFRQALYFMECGFNLHDTMIYNKIGPPTVDIMLKRYYQHFEYMFVFSKGLPTKCNHITEIKLWVDHRKNDMGQRNKSGNHVGGAKHSERKDKIRGNVWKYNSGGGHNTSDKIAHDHPAIFPEALARDHILSWSNPGDLVLDCFAGSGTTLKAAKQLKRDYIGIEISAEYVTIAEKRLLATTPALFA
jgi:site-specific DNA-methyltransferase (adenine-specific)